MASATNPKLVIQKFGGSSVRSPQHIKKVAQKIAQKHAENYQVVVVVSAMGDTTDELIALAQQVSPHHHDREMDVLLSAGERIAMALLSMALHDLNLSAVSYTGSQAGIITDENHNRARILTIRPQRIAEALAQNKIVIVAGFQGVSRSKEITTLGRGGSDTTAVALAAALKANRCEIFTDVAGIGSADPRLVPQAKIYKVLPVDLVLEMCAQGAQIMHARSIEIAREYQFPIYVEQTMIAPLNSAELTNIELTKVVSVAHRKNLNLYQIALKNLANPLNELIKSLKLVHHFLYTHDGYLEVAIDPSENQAALELLQPYLKNSGVVKVSLIGYQMQNSADIAARAHQILAEHKIACFGLTTQAQSVTVLIAETNLAITVQQFHQAFIEH